MVYVRGDWNILKNKNPGLSQVRGFIYPDFINVSSNIRAVCLVDSFPTK